MNLAANVACPHADRCGGCALIGLPYDAQLDRKLQRVAAALSPYRVLDDVARAPVVATGKLTGYRTRTKLMVDGAGAIGLFSPGTHSVVDIPECKVMPPTMHACVEALRPLLIGSGVEAIDVREVAGDERPSLLVTLIAGAASVERARALVADVAKLPSVASVAVSARDRGAVQLLGRDLEVRSGPMFVPDRVHPDAPFVHASHGGFVQAHRDQAHGLQSHVIALLRERLGDLRGKRVVELHCGEGGLGLRLSQLGAQVLLVDSFEPAITRLREAARAQQLTIDAWACDATEAATRLVQSRQPIDAVVLDPPRRGVPSALRKLLADLKPKAVVYVSCEAESFARDLHHLAWLGYRAQQITPVDLIPLSAEVESVTCLVPSAPPALDVLYEDAQVAIVNKPPHLPTTPQGEHAVSLVSLARAQLNAPNLTAVHRLDAGTSGACILAKHNDHVHGWSLALAAGDKRYLALVRGVIRDKGSIKRALREGHKQLDARTRYQRDEVIGGHSLVSAMPDEGRTHQIRRHLASIKHAVLGDTRYGDPKSNRHLEHKHGLDRPFLHCASITLAAPTTGNPITTNAPLAPDLTAVLTRLRG